MTARPARFAGFVAAAGAVAALAAAAPAAARPADDPAAPSMDSSAPRAAQHGRPAGSSTAGSSTAGSTTARAHRRAPIGTAATDSRVKHRRPAAAVVTSVSAATPAADSAAVDPLSALVNNATPRPTSVQVAQSPTGPVSGTLSANDLDSVPVTFAVSRGPTHGAVAVTPAGQFTYTPDPLLAHAPHDDTFVVTASDADSGFHIHGLGGLLNLLTFGLIGASGHTAAATVTVRVGVFNNAPTGVVGMGGPDPATGEIAGRIVSSDANGDLLTHTGPTATPSGSVTVGADGAFRYTPTAEALAAAAPGERDTFTVTVDDGYGGTVQVNVSVPLGVSSPPSELSTFCGCTLMPADTVFHADVSTLPVLATSQTWTTLLGGTLMARWGGEPWLGSTGGMPVNVVDADRPGETVIFNRGYWTSGPSIDPTPYAIPDYPLVEGMPDQPAWDRHLLVFQTGTCISQELYNVANGVELPAAGVLDGIGNALYASMYGNTWIAEAGVHVDMASALYPAQGWANASQLPYLPLILRPDDLERGTIDHMLGISIAKDRGTGYSWPARWGDGTGTNPDGVPMGTVFRLSADFDVSGYAPATQVVLRALQQHGAVIYDSFGAGQDGAGLMAMSNGWSGTEYITAKQELNTVPLSAFEAVDILSLALDPETGWQIVN